MEWNGSWVGRRADQRDAGPYLQDYGYPGRDGRHACPQELDSEQRIKTSGFTLLEILVAVALLATAFTIIWSTFSTTLDGWKRSGEFIDRITHGDFVIDQLENSLRSTAFFPNRPDKYGFWLEARGGGDAPRDIISWVTSGSAFMKPDDPLSKGLHRIMISVEDAPGGGSGLAIRAFQHLQKEIKKDDCDPWFVSSRVIGLGCRTYNFEDETWEDEWEDTNAVPSLVEITVYMEPVEKYEPPIKLQRIVEIPVGPAVTGAVKAVEAPAGQDAQGNPNQNQPNQTPSNQAPSGENPQGQPNPGGNQPGDTKISRGE